MKELQDRIIKDGVFKSGGILKVDSFLNHQIDIDLMDRIGAEFRRLFPDPTINKILTIEASGIAIASMAARHFKAPVVFAKKSESRNLDGNIYTAEVHSYTHNKDYLIRVSEKFLTPEDHVLVIDDFLANGKALMGLISIVEQSGAKLAGCGICIEKGFQEGGKELRAAGVNLHSLAIVDLDESGNLIFR